MAYDLIGRLKIVDQMSQPIRRALVSLRGMRKETDTITRAVRDVNKETKLWRDQNGYLRDEIGRFASESKRVTTIVERLGGGFRGLNMSGAHKSISGLTTSVLGLAGAYASVEGAKKSVDSILSRAISFESEQMKMEALMNNTKKAQRFIKDLQKMAIDSPVSGFKDFLAGSNVFLTFTKSEDKLKRLLLLAERLRELNTEQSYGDSVYAIAEALSGDYISLKERFRFSGKEAKVFSGGGKGLPLDEAMDQLDKILNAKGITSAYIEKKSESTESKINKIKEQWDLLLTNAGTPALDAIKPPLDRISQMFADGKMKGIQDFLTNTIKKGAENFEKLVVSTDKFLTRIQKGDLNGMKFGDVLIKATEEGMDALNKWLETGGSDKIAKVAAPLTKTAVGVGLAVGKGILRGVVSYFEEHPVAAAIGTFFLANKVLEGSIPGGGGTLRAAATQLGKLLGLAIAVPLALEIKKGLDSALQYIEKKKEEKKYFLDTDYGKAMKEVTDHEEKVKKGEIPKDAPVFKGKTSIRAYEPSTWEKVKNWFANPFGHYNGIDYVPYDGYKAILHKGERVVTASENRKGNSVSVGNINITISGANKTTREQAREIAQFIVEEIEMAGGAMA